MIGLTTHGYPTASAPARSSSTDPAKRYGVVGSASSSCARTRSRSRSMQMEAISALGTTCTPRSAAAASSCVAIASTSGTMMSGWISSNNARNCSAFAMSRARLSCATCCAGAFSYESAVHTHAPNRMSSSVTSLPSSPEPRNRTRVGCLPRGVPNARLSSVMVLIVPSAWDSSAFERSGRV